MSIAGVRWALDEAPVEDPTERHVLLLYGWRAGDPKGENPDLVWTSTLTLAAATGYDRSTIMRAQARLEDRGVLELRGRRNRAKLYRIAREVKRRTAPHVAERNKWSSATQKTRTAKRQPPAHAASGYADQLPLEGLAGLSLVDGDQRTAAS